MSTKETGGAAFPTEHYEFVPPTINSKWHWNPHPGMTLRDWFAGKAFALPDVRFASMFSSRWASKIAYTRADAMIAERGK